jgi:hypothetical protein
MTNLSSRAHTHRLRNGFLTVLWLAKNNPAAFSCIDRDAREILIAMLESQGNQKLGRKVKYVPAISSKQAQLLWRIRDAGPKEQKVLVRHAREFGLSLVKDGFISILPDDNLKNWKLVLSPEGEVLAGRLET